MPNFKTTNNEDVTLIVDTLKNKLVRFLINEADYFGKNKQGTIEKWLDYAACQQARAVFTTIALLLDYEADTGSGDMLLAEIYDRANLWDNVDYDDFDLFMWSCLS